MADPPLSAKAGILADDFRHQLVRMKASFHQGIGFAGSHDLDRLLGGRVAMRSDDQLQYSKIETQRRCEGPDLGFGPTRIGLMIFAGAASSAPTSEVSSQG